MKKKKHGEQAVRFSFTHPLFIQQGMIAQLTGDDLELKSTDLRSVMAVRFASTTIAQCEQDGGGKADSSGSRSGLRTLSVAVLSTSPARTLAG